MRRTCLALSCYLTLCAQGGVSAHPNDSIAPEKPKPTPYGFQITRSQDVHLRHIGPWVEDQPGALAHNLDLVRESEEAGGAYTTELAEPLQALARSYQAQGKHRDAVQAFQRALHLLRIRCIRACAIRD